MRKWIVISSVISGLVLFLGLTGCNECKNAQKFKTELRTLKTQLEEAAAVPTSGPSDDLTFADKIGETCTWFGKDGDKNLDPGIKQVERAMQKVFYQEKYECLREESREFCRTSPSGVLCHVSRLCFEEKITPQFLDGYKDSQDLIGALRAEKIALQALCTAKAESNFALMRTQLNVARLVLADIQGAGDAVLVKSGCDRSPSGTDPRK